MRVCGAAALAVVMIGLSGGSARAATVGENAAGTVLTVDARDLPRSFLTVITSGSDVELTGGDGSGDPYFLTRLTAQTGCTNVDERVVRCAGFAAYDKIVVRMGEGADTFWTFADLAAEFDVDLGAGADSFIAANNSQRVVGHGGPGPDGLTGGLASDHLEGGPGSDGLDGSTNTPGGSDELIGGDGFDSSYYGARTANLQLSLDGLANDGDPAAGEQDNLIEIEDVSGGSGNDAITGDAGPNNLYGNGGNDRLDGGAGFDSYAGYLGDDTILARDGLSERIVCDAGTDTVEVDTIDRPLDCEAVASSPALEPDRDGDGVDRPLDCDDLDPVVRPGAFDPPGDGRDQDCSGTDAVATDLDRDGFLPPADCDDGDQARHPGALDVPGNALDEDCDGVKEPFPRATAFGMLAWRVGRRATEIVSMAVGDLDGGERVRLTCKGKGCRFAARRHTVKRGAELLRLAGDVRGMKLRPGAALAVAVTRADGVTKTITFTMRKGKAPRRTQRCATPNGGGLAGC